jgi:hypothetical protein
MARVPKSDELPVALEDVLPADEWKELSGRAEALRSRLD